MNPSIDPLRTLDVPQSSDLNDETVDRTKGIDTDPSFSAPVGAPSVPGYIITAEIARGGMGMVYAARDLTLDREVAIKTLLPSANAGRFERESKITAQLPHPNIPPIHALGKLADGSPFLAMKLIRGRTLAAELKAHTDLKPEWPRLLQVFEQIAMAVGFAHSRGIIHRDLKPANIMVGEFGEVQVMDWGLAIFLASVEPGRVSARSDEGEGEEFPQSDTTFAGSVMGTPSYMAPEQARGEAVDARADVFALGGLLNAILTGQAVFGGTTVKETISQAASGDTKLTLSRLKSSGADAEVIAIAEQCLNVDKDLRPADGRAVAKLVAEYRHSVEARLREAETQRAASEVKAQEQAKRRKAMSWAGSVVAAVLLAGISVSLWQMFRAKDAEKATAEQLTKTQLAEKATKEQLIQTEAARADATEKNEYYKNGIDIMGSIFEDLNPKANYATVAELRNALKVNVEKAVKKLNEGKAGDPLTVALMQNRLGQTLLGLGEPKQAIILFDKSRETRQSLLGNDHASTLKSMNDLAVSYMANGQTDRALLLYEELFKLQKVKLGPDHPHTLTSMNNLATGYHEAGQLEKALTLHEETLTIRKTKLGLDHTDTLQSMNNLASTYRESDQLDKAIPLQEAAYKLAISKLGNDHPDTLKCMNNLAITYKEGGQLTKATLLFEKTLKLMRIKHGNEHPDTLGCMNNLAEGYRATKQIEKAIPLCEETFKLAKAKLGRDHPNTLISMNNLAGCYTDSGQFDKALLLYEEAYTLAKAKLGPGHNSTLITMNNLAGSYKDSGKFDRAMLLYEELVNIHGVKQSPNPFFLLRSMNNLALCCLESRQFEKAVPIFEEAFKIAKIKLGPEDSSTLNVMDNLGRAYCYAKQGAKASATLKGFVDIKRNLLPQGDPRFARLIVQVALDLSNSAEFATAETMLREALTIREKKEPDAWSTFNTHAMLGATLLGQKKYMDAESQLVKGYEGMKAREKTIPKGAEIRIPVVLDQLIELYTALNKPEEVKKYQELRAKYPTAKK